MLKCPIHELPKEIILTNFYARLSRQDKEMLDASSSGVFQKKSVEERWDLLERIQRNTEDWEIDKGIEPAINYEHDYVESYVKSDYFNTFCSKIGLDSHLMIDFCKNFASHVDSFKRQETSIMNLLKSYLLIFMLLTQFCLQLYMKSLLSPQG